MFTIRLMLCTHSLSSTFPALTSPAHWPCFVLHILQAIIEVMHIKNIIAESTAKIYAGIPFSVMKVSPRLAVTLGRPVAHDPLIVIGGLRGSDGLTTFVVHQEVSHWSSTPAYFHI